MFTGIVQKQAKLLALTKKREGLELEVEATLAPTHFTKGNSIAVNGVCLTVENYNEAAPSFSCTAVLETLTRSNIKDFTVGDSLNLEAPLTLNTPLAGHFVLGHVDGVGEVLQTGEEFIVRLPHELIKFCPEKGSICLNGVSLTIAEQKEDQIRMALIPETLKETNLGSIQKGASLNVEIDPLARYLYQLQKV